MNVWKSVHKSVWGNGRGFINPNHGIYLQKSEVGPAAIGRTTFTSVPSSRVTGKTYSNYVNGVLPAWDAAGVTRVIAAGGEWIDGYYFPAGTVVVEGANIEGIVEIYGNGNASYGTGSVGIVFRGCRLRFSGLACINARINHGMHIAVLYCDLGAPDETQANRQGDAFKGWGMPNKPFIIYRNYISWVQNGGEFTSHVSLIENYLEQLLGFLTIHIDGFQFSGGDKELTVLRNYISAGIPDHIASAQSLFNDYTTEYGAGYYDVLYQDNFLDGGSYTLYPPEQAYGVFNCKFIGNLFGTTFSAKGGINGVVYPTDRLIPDKNGNVWRNNRWAKSQKLISITTTPDTYVHITADDAAITYFGRWDNYSPTQRASSWANCGFTFNFTGTEIILNILDPNSYYEFQIDGGSWVPFKILDMSYAIYGLTDTLHMVIISRKTQSDDVVVFSGVDLLAGKTISAVTVQPVRKYEFLGGSVALGIHSEDTAVDGGAFYDNARESFCQQLATYHNAECRIISQRVIGLYISDEKFIDYYTRQYSGIDNIIYDFTSWTPTAIFISLTHDDGIVLTDAAAFRTALSDLITLIRLNNPAPYVFIIPSPQSFMSSDFLTNTNTVITAKHSGGDNKIILLDVNAGGQLLSSGDYADGTTNPTTAGHTKILNAIKILVDETLGINIPVTGATMNKASTNIALNRTEQLVVTISPFDATDQTGVWSTSNAGVATVDQTGLVTCVSVASCNILFTTHDGSFVATCAVTVIAAIIDVESVSLNKATDSLAWMGTDTLVATVLPANATDKTVTWSSSDAEVISVDSNGLCTALRGGSAIITVTTNDGSFTANCTVSTAFDANTLHYATTGDTTAIGIYRRSGTTPVITIYYSNGTNETLTSWTSNYATATKTGLGTGEHYHRIVIDNPANLVRIRNVSSGTMHATKFENLNLLAGALTNISFTNESALSILGRINLNTILGTISVTGTAITAADMDRIYADMVTANAAHSGTSYFKDGTIVSHANRATLIARGWTEINAAP